MRWEHSDVSKKAHELQMHCQSDFSETLYHEDEHLHFQDEKAELELSHSLEVTRLRWDLKGGPAFLLLPAGLPKAGS